MGGRSQARAISQAATTASASALPRDSTPSATAAASRARRGRSSPMAASRGSAPRDASSVRKRDTPHVDDAVADADDLGAMADEHDRRARAGARDDGVQHPSLECRVEV